jgi:hypothetical protein
MTPSMHRGVTIDVSTSARKKWRKRTRPNGEIMMFHIVIQMCLRVVW